MQEKLGDTLMTIVNPERDHAKPSSREQVGADIATIRQSIPLSYVNEILSDS